METIIISRDSFLVNPKKQALSLVKIHTRKKIKTEQGQIPFSVAIQQKEWDLAKEKSLIVDIETRPDLKKLFDEVLDHAEMNFDKA
jgi:hypothetical protein